MGSKLIIFKHQQMKNDVYYMRMYCGDRKYKVLSLRTDNKDVARSRCLEKWRTLQNQIDLGGNPFEPTTQESLDQYLNYLEELYETKQIKKHTLQGKKTCLKKLSIFLQPYTKPSDAPPSLLNDYVNWRRTKNWDKNFHCIRANESRLQCLSCSVQSDLYAQFNPLGFSTAYGRLFRWRSWLLLQLRQHLPSVSHSLCHPQTHFPPASRTFRQ